MLSSGFNTAGRSMGQYLSKSDFAPFWLWSDESAELFPSGPTKTVGDATTGSVTTFPFATSADILSPEINGGLWGLPLGLFLILGFLFALAIGSIVRLRADELKTSVSDHVGLVLSPYIALRDSFCGIRDQYNGIAERFGETLDEYVNVGESLIAGRNSLSTMPERLQNALERFLSLRESFSTLYTLFSGPVDLLRQGLDTLWTHLETLAGTAQTLSDQADRLHQGLSRFFNLLQSLSAAVDKITELGDDLEKSEREGHEQALAAERNEKLSVQMELDALRGSVVNTIFSSQFLGRQPPNGRLNMLTLAPQPESKLFATSVISHWSNKSSSTPHMSMRLKHVSINWVRLHETINVASMIPRWNNGVWRRNDSVWRQTFIL